MCERVNAGTYGRYWSSTPYTSGSFSAYWIWFYSGSQSMAYSDRYNAGAVRPVVSE